LTHRITEENEIGAEGVLTDHDSHLHRAIHVRVTANLNRTTVAINLAHPSAGI